jgi:hypothetical protein
LTKAQVADVRQYSSLLSICVCVWLFFLVHSDIHPFDVL